MRSHWTEIEKYLEDQKIAQELIGELRDFHMRYTVEDQVKERVEKPDILFYGKKILEMSTAALLQGDNLLLSGAKATGKNVLCETLAWIFGRPEYDISFHVNTDSADLIGTDTFINNEVRLRKGPIYQCAEFGGFGILDEINMAKNDAVSVLHATLDHRRRIDIPGYNRILLHPATRFIGTMNYGYAGTRELNEALVSRFMVIDMPEMDEDSVLFVLRQHFPDGEKSALKAFAGLFLDLQIKAYHGEISTKSLDLRGLVSAVKATRSGLSPIDAIQMGIINKSFDVFEKEIVEGKDPDNGFASKADNWAKNLVLETMATYNKEFNKNHSLNAVIAFSYERGDYGNKAMTAKGFPQDITEDFDMSAAVNPNKPISGRGMTSLVSFLGRANYSLMNKYLFTASFRRDGSSKFAPGNKWSNFASGAIAWRASEEEFIKSLNIFSNLKIRASYGQTGNQAIGAYATRDYLTVANYPINGALASGFANLTWRGPANPDLKWETTTQYNAGIDMGFFENRVNFTVDVYYKKTSDLLQNIQIPQSTGFSNMTTNFGDVINKGLEITGKFYPISGKKFKWDFDANISFNRNKIEGLPGDQFAQSWSDADAVFIQRNGMPIGTIFGYVEDGFYDNIAEVRADPFYANESEAVCKSMIGEVKYKDLDGKPGITDADRQIIGDANPDFTFGMTHNFSYKNFSLSFFLQGCVGGDIFNANLIKVTMSGIGNIPQEMYDTRWTPENRDLAQWPKAYSGYGRTMKLSDRYVEDGSYLRMKNINLGYRWNAPIKGIEYINFYTSVSNVFTITNYSWFDPDVNSFGGDASRRGVDMFSYPSSRTFSFGVQCTF